MFQIHMTSASSRVQAGNRRALQDGFRKPPHAAQVTGGRRAIGGAGAFGGNGVTSAPSGTPTAAAASRLDSTCRAWEAWALDHGSLSQGLGFRAHITDATAWSPQPSQCASCACIAKLENANRSSPRWTSYRQWPQPRQRPAVAAPAALMRTAAPAQTSVAAAARARAAAPAARSACVRRGLRICSVTASQTIQPMPCPCSAQCPRGRRTNRGTCVSTSERKV